MSASFSRSIRILEQESARRTGLFLLVVSGLLLLWLGWFLFYPLAELEVADTAVVQNESRIQATFPPEALLYLQAGQTAALRLDAFPWTEYGSVAVSVDRVDRSLRDGRVVVELSPVNEQVVTIPLQREMTGSVTVEVGQTTPAGLLWQIIGRQSGRLDGEAANSNEPNP